MMRRSPVGALGAFVMIMALAGCRDSTVDPRHLETTLEMRQDSLPFEEETLALGATLQLTVVLLNAAGTPQNAGAVTWTSTDQTVASVSASGQVSALQVGTTRIIVRSGEQADTGLVNVALPLAGEPVCDAGTPVLSLAVGEVRTFAGQEATTLCLDGGAGGADFLLVPFNGSNRAGARLSTRLIASNALTPETNLEPSILPLPKLPIPEGPVSDAQFHRLHLERSRAEFATALRASVAAPSAPAYAVAAVGDLLDLNAATIFDTGCSSPEYRTGRVMAVSERAIIVADTANPRNGFSEADFDTIAETFDDLIWPLDTGAFGEPTDIDENDRVIVFYTRAVNELTPAGADSYVGGFFYNRDLFPKTGTSACAGSNEAEMFYMLVPDPAGQINGHVRTRDFVFERTFSVLAHEFQHLINDSRRLYVNQALVWEEAWLNEGLSHIAEELAFYAAAGLEPGVNLGSGAITGEHLRALNRYNLDNLERYNRYLRAPETNSLLGDVSLLATRGAVWSFLRYMADRDPGSDATLWKNLVNSTTSGLANIEAVLGVNPRDWMHDWEVAVYADDSGVATDAIYTQPSWNFRVLSAMLDTSGRFPLRTTTINSTSPAHLLDGGAAMFIRLGATAGTRRAVRMTVNEMPPPSRLRLSVMRTR